MKRYVVIIITALLCFGIGVTTNRCRRPQPVVLQLPIDGKWAKLLLVLDQIEQNYVDSISYDQVVEKTLPILLQSLDPHSVYLPPKELAKADESLEGAFTGIGIEFNVPDDTAVVVSVIPGGPAFKVGMLSGDRIVGVNGVNVAGVQFSQDSLISLLRGPRGTKVNVDVRRNGVSEALPFTIRRDIIPIKSVDVSMMLTDKLGYIKLSKFSKSTHKEMLAALQRLKSEGMTSLLLDLRDNPGGYMDQAYLLANEFLAAGDEIVYLQGRKREREDLKADGRGRSQNLNLYVAIDDGSASSSEIVAGAIQDNDRGIIIGRRSFGKGLVQEPFMFSDNSGVRMTIARFYTPSGRCIQKPYSKDYNYDIYERYLHGEMQNADSIKIDSSLAFKTLKQGRTVYGGGGIIPDIFIPIDTAGVSTFWLEVNRKSMQMKFSSYFADRHRAKLQSVKSIEQLDALFAGENIAEQFLLFASAEGVKASEQDWEKSGDIILLQLKGLIGRYASLPDDTYYHYVLQIDNVVKKVIEEDANVTPRADVDVKEDIVEIEQVSFN